MTTELYVEPRAARQRAAVCRLEFPETPVPIFEYDCESCRGRFEVLVRSGKGRKPSCPDCGGRKCRKLFSTFATGGRARDGASASSASASNCASCSRSSCAGCR